MANEYASTDQLRTQLGDTSNLSTELLDRAVEAASRAIDEHCGRRFWQDASTQVKRYRPRLSDEVYVDDISTSTGLVVKTDTTGDGTYDTTWVLDTDYQLEPLDADTEGAAYAWYRLAAIGTKRFPVATNRRALLQVTARFGWAAVPVAVEEACILKAASLFARKDAPFGVAGFSDFGAVRITRADPDVLDLLSPRVRVNLPER